MLAYAEDAITERLKEVLGKSVKTVETLPGPWDEQSLALALRQVPGVYVYWDGGRASNRGKRARISAVYRIYAVTGHASGERERRRGAAHQVGAYEILQQVVPAMSGLDAGTGTLEFQGIAVLSPASAQRKGITVYEAKFLADLAWPPLKYVSELEDFSGYDGTHQAGDAEYESSITYEEEE